MSKGGSSGSPHLCSPRHCSIFPALPGLEATVHLVKNPWLPVRGPHPLRPHPHTALFALSSKAEGPLIVSLTFQTTTLLPYWLQPSHLPLRSTFREGLEPWDGPVSWLRRGAAVGVPAAQILVVHHPRGGLSALRQGSQREGGHLTRTTGQSPLCQSSQHRCSVLISNLLEFQRYGKGVPLPDGWRGVTQARGHWRGLCPFLVKGHV